MRSSHAHSKLRVSDPVRTDDLDRDRYRLMYSVISFCVVGDEGGEETWQIAHVELRGWC